MSGKNSTNLRQTKGGEVIQEEIAAYIATHQIQSYNDSQIIKRIESLENRSQIQPEVVDLTNYLTSEQSYQTFVTYSALQSQMTTNIKDKHLELGIDALIDEKLKMAVIHSSLAIKQKTFLFQNKSLQLSFHEFKR